jgi:hypothetical protein
MPLDFLHLNQPWEPGLLGKLIPVAEQAIESQTPCSVFKLTVHHCPPCGWNRNF